MHSLPSQETTDLLVAYALDALEPEELERVGRVLDEQPDLSTLLSDLRATSGMLAYGLPLSEPPAELRTRVLDYAVGRTSRPQRKRLRVGTPRQAWARGWLGALGGLVAVALVALLVAFGQLGGVQSELARVQQQLLEARQQLQTAQQELAAADQQLVAAQAENDRLAQTVAESSALAELSGNGGRATVLQSAAGQLLLAAQLPPLEPGRVYQLWLIAGQNAPVSAGVFTVSNEGYGVIALGPGAATAGATLAVTNEPAPGSPGPTSDVLLVGQIS